MNMFTYLHEQIVKNVFLPVCLRTTYKQTHRQISTDVENWWGILLSCDQWLCKVQSFWTIGGSQKESGIIQQRTCQFCPTFYNVNFEANQQFPYIISEKRQRQPRFC